LIKNKNGLIIETGFLYLHRIKLNVMKVYFDQEGRTKLLHGVKTLSAAVKSTLGPSGKTVIIDSPNHTRGLTITKDGVTVAKSVVLDDPLENMAVRIVREASERTALTAGDGTTTAVVITEALVEGGMAINADWSTVKRIDELSQQTEKELEKVSVRTTKRWIEDIATISANNDRHIGKLIADTYKKVGKNGLVTVEKSMTTETYAEVIKGIRMDRGYTNKLFVNNQKNDEFVAEDCYILMTDIELSSIEQIKELINPLVQSRKPLLIVAPCSQNFSNTIALNVVQNNLKYCIVEPPQFGYKQHELMQDLAVATGGRFFSALGGDDTALISFTDLGLASKVVVSRDKTVLIPSPTEDNTETLDILVSELKSAHDQATKKADRDFIKQRISYLTGGVGIIHVGGNSDVEQKELYDRVDDSVCAVQSAMEEGIVAGGGLALYRVGQKLLKESYNDRVVECFVNAIQAPLKQIIKNADIDLEKSINVIENLLLRNEGLNVKTDEIVDMFEMGIVDPLKVTKTALKNAVSVANTILTTNAIISN
jgi:chaperonin GroEL